MDTKSELDKVRQEIKIVLEPLEKREKELEAICEQEFIEKQKEIFKNIEGKLYYGDKNTWSGFKDVIFLVKVLNCDNWSEYNSCNILQFEIRFEKEIFSSLFIRRTIQRVDTFKTHFKELTPELFENIKQLSNKSLDNALSNFTK